MTDIDAETFIENQLREAGIFTRRKGHDFAISCPFHQHSGTKQLLNIHIDGSKIHCWSCDVGGTYNTLAEKLGLKKLPRSTQYAFSGIEREINNIELERGLPALPEGLQPWTGEYRGMPEEFLARFGSKKWYDVDSSAWRILWPITYNEKLQGYVARRIDDDKQMRYANGPKGVLQSRRALWPIDDPMIRETVVLTEGPYSALRLLHAGIPAVSILGAANWHGAKITMLMQRKHPVRGLIIAFDGDDAGWRGTKVTYRSVRDVFERVEIYQCPDDKDPGDMSQRRVEELRSLYEEVRDSLSPKKIKKKEVAQDGGEHEPGGA